MQQNTYGHLFRFHSFGESHGPAMGVVIDGCPAGLELSQDVLLHQLQRRRPGFRPEVSARVEADEVEILSGVYQGKTLGTPIAMITRNQGQRSEDYQQLKKAPRPGHADDTWKTKFGHADHRGGGRSSGRETVARVMAGAVAKMFCQAVYPGLTVMGYAQQIGPYSLEAEQIDSLRGHSLTDVKVDTEIDAFPARFPNGDQSKDIISLLENAKRDGKSYGGLAELVIKGVPAGLGEPVFRKAKAELAHLSLSLGATTSFELGAGLQALGAEGSEFHAGDADKQIYYGGVRGGITTGEPIVFRVGFKPTASVKDVAKKGRHDPCIVPRAIPVLQAMTYCLLADYLLAQRLNQI